MKRKDFEALQEGDRIKIKRGEAVVTQETDLISDKFSKIEIEFVMTGFKKWITNREIQLLKI